MAAPGRSSGADVAVGSQGRRATTTTIDSFGALASHPFGVMPMGNYWMAAEEIQSLRTRDRGLGLFAVLDDQTVLLLLQTFDDLTLLRLARCSRAMYVLSSFDDLWRSKTIERFKGDFGVFQENWRATYRLRACREMHPHRSMTGLVPLVPIKVPGFFSDYLFSSFRCSTVPLDILCRTSAEDTIDRRAGLSCQQFINEYAIPNRPVIITDVVPSWPAYEKWDLEYLVSKCGVVEFRAEAVNLNLSSYASYSSRCGLDGGSFEESPLYLFDKHFGSRTDLKDDYTVPEYFREDLFSRLGSDERPDHRWLIIGPPRSGSTFHLDPNQTSAWNAVIRGSKKWIMFPPDAPPPGVYPSEDGSEVTSPVSLAEWLLTCYDQMAKWPVKPVECICRAGELIYVPRGWWHCVMNLEETIAITQNFVHGPNLHHVLRFLATKQDQISGFRGSCEDLYDRFVDKLGPAWSGIVERERDERADAARRLEERRAKKRKLAESGGGLASLFSKQPVTASASSDGTAHCQDEEGGFTFSFF